MTLTTRYVDSPSSPEPDIDLAVNSKVHDLPVEILSYIFCFILSRAHEGRNVHVLISQWRPVLHVCRTWRTVAFQSTDLWRLVPLDHPEWTRMALRLSGGRTLSLFFTPTSVREIRPTSIRDTIVKVLAADHRRIRDLHLRLLFPEDVPDQLLLAALKTVSPDELQDFELSAGDLPIVLEGCVFKSEPALRRLSLEFCELRGSPRIFSSQLKMLNLSCCFYKAGYNLSSNIRDIQSLGLLRELRINALSESSLNQPSEIDLPRVRLPLLEFLELRGDYRSLHNYLAHIDAAYTCCFRLRTVDLCSSFERIPVKHTIESLAELLQAKLTSEIVIQACANAHVTLCTSTWRDGRLHYIVHNCGEDDEEPRPLLDCDFYWGPISEEFRGPAEAEPPTLALLTALVPRIIPTMIVKVALNAADWLSLGPLLSSVDRLHFFFPRCAIHFPTDLLRCSTFVDLRLTTIEITYHPDKYTEQSDVDSFPSVRDLILSSSSHISVRLQVGQSLPTIDEVETLRACGDRLDLLEYGLEA